LECLNEKTENIRPFFLEIWTVNWEILPVIPHDKSLLFLGKIDLNN